MRKTLAREKVILACKHLMLAGFTESSATKLFVSNFFFLTEIHAFKLSVDQFFFIGAAGVPVMLQVAT